mgnify:CR=1 FL=1|jgi:ectoine hydroxylase-related dioxygenase (phytanoyl-CoA dioxygenase family)|tara:strand:+ start:274 stop:1083 length:810 start_codon:yes stop_codon:yes gene_type:complete
MNFNFLKTFLKYKKYQYVNYCKYNYKYKKDLETNQYVTQLKRHGFVVINNYFSKQKCNKIKESIDNFIKSNPKLIVNDKYKSDSRIYGAENISKEIRVLVENFINFTKLIGQNYTQQDLGLYMMMANKTEYKANNEGSGDGWHKDSYSKQFKSIIYLNDVDENNGPFQIIKKSNSNLFMLNLFLNIKNKYPSTRFTADEIVNVLKVKKEKLIDVKGSAGSLILVDTSYIHRGKPLEKNTRYALTNYFYPKNTFSNHESHFKPLVKKIVN